jgi:hypothetical protein
MKSKTTKTPKITTSENLEERFDAGQDVSDYFDFSRAVVWGGKRAGAGRKPLGKVRKQVLLSAAAVQKITAIAKKKKQSFSVVIENACVALR